MPKKSASKNGSPDPRIRKPVNRALSLLQRAANARTAVQESLARSGANIDNNVLLGQDRQRRRLIVPLEDFVMQWAFGLRGLVSGTILDFIADENVGKSTMAHTIIGWGMNHSCLSAYFESENKPLMRNRIERCLHRNPMTAAQYYDAVNLDTAFEIREAVKKMMAWLKTIRDRNNPETYVDFRYPVIVVWDTFSKMMSPSEALGLAGYAKNEAQKEEAVKKAVKTGDKKKVAKAKKEEEAKELGEGSNFEHASLAHKLSRRLPAVLRYYNAVLILNRHKNDKIDMGLGGGSFYSSESGSLHNNVSIGGKAFLQSAAYEMIGAHKGYEEAMISGNKTKVRRIVSVNMKKNTFAPNCRQFEYSLILEPQRDTDTYLEPALTCNHFLPELLQRFKVMPITNKNKNSWTCRELKLEDATTTEFANAFYSNPQLVEAVGAQMGIYGYGQNSPFVLPESLTAIEAESLQPQGPAPDLDLDDPETPEATTTEVDGAEAVAESPAEA